MMLLIREVAKRYRVSPRTIHRWVSNDIFPKPIKVGPGRGLLRWNESDLLEFERVRQSVVLQTWRERLQPEVQPYSRQADARSSGT
jgi:predicted DNA-binding transcriptional regulator AlpA